MFLLKIQDFHKIIGKLSSRDVVIIILRFIASSPLNVTCFWFAEGFHGQSKLIPWYHEDPSGWNVWNVFGTQ